MGSMIRLLKTGRLSWRQISDHNLDGFRLEHDRVDDGGRVDRVGGVGEKDVRDSTMVGSEVKAQAGSLHSEIKAIATGKW